MITCPNDGSVCYSLHTPFGIVERGCYNELHNESIYVCGCNLCNYLSLSEMPYVFKNKKEWVDNIHDLSHWRQLTKTVHKNMVCLHCEVDGTKNEPEYTNCSEGTMFVYVQSLVVRLLLLHWHIVDTTVAPKVPHLTKKTIKKLRNLFLFFNIISFKLDTRPRNLDNFRLG